MYMCTCIRFSNVFLQNEIANLTNQVEQLDTKSSTTEKANKNLNEQLKEIQV